MEDAQKIISEGLADGAAAGAAFMQKMQIEAILSLQLRILAKLDKRDEKEVADEFADSFRKKFLIEWTRHCGQDPAEFGLVDE